MKKRVLAIIITAALCICAVPATLVAAEGDDGTPVFITGEISNTTFEMNSTDPIYNGTIVNGTDPIFNGTIVNGTTPIYNGTIVNGTIPIYNGTIPPGNETVTPGNETELGELPIEPTTQTVKAKKANSITKVTKKKTLKAKTLKKKKKITFKIAATVKGGAKKTFKVTVPKKAKKYIKVSSAGKVTVKKGLKKGTYSLKIKITAAETAVYKKTVSPTKTLKLKIK